MGRPAYVVKISTDEHTANQGTVVLDSTPPQVQLRTPLRITSSRACVIRVIDRMTSTRSATLRVDGSIVRRLAHGTSLLIYRPADGWSPGSHLVVVDALDAVGNKAHATFRLTTVGPSSESKVARITPQNATAALESLLKSRFHAVFTAAPRKWLACPSEEINFFPENHFAACEFEFGRPGGNFYGGSTTVRLINGKLDASKYFEVGSYRKNLQTCQIPPTKSGWVNGAYLTGRTLRYTGSLGDARTCQRLIGPAGMAADLEYPIATRPNAALRNVVAHVHGTNTAGFEARVVFPCRASRIGSRFRFDCRNRLGDRFIYTFVLHTR
jgi:hypothetical protein